MTLRRGVIFDLDGTLVDSGLDFDQMRLEMQLEPGRPVLEAISEFDEPRASHCREILERHEWAGVERAVPMPGAVELVARLSQRQIQMAVLTRNSREIALATLARCGFRFDDVIGREDAPAKPDPTAIRQLCQRWQLEPRHVVVVGDYRFDLEAGRSAGARTVLYTAGKDMRLVSWAAAADLHLACFTQPERLLELLEWSDAAI